LKFNKLFSFIGILTISLVNASRSEFYGKYDSRPKLFKILDDHVGTIKINLDNEMWAAMKQSTDIDSWLPNTNTKKFKTENATMEFNVEGTTYRVKLEPGQFSFQIGESGSQTYINPGYNINLINGSLYEVSSFYLFSNIRDSSFIREKLATDILYKMNILANSANFVNVEVNNEYLGLFVLSNKIDKDFIKRYFGEKNTSNLYECKNGNIRFEDESIIDNCKNMNYEWIDSKYDIVKFVDTINNVKSVEDIDKAMDVESFLYNIAYEFITLSWDHFLGLSHNYLLYKRMDKKWMMLVNEYDETLGQDYSPELFSIFDTFSNKKYLPNKKTLNVPNISFRDLDKDHKIFKYLIYYDDTRFRSIIGDIVKTVFNPKILNPRIDEIADLIRDDLTISRYTSLSGFDIDDVNPKWNMTHFEDGINYVNWNANDSQSYCYGLKFFIEERFKYICHTYGIDPETLELIEPFPQVSFWGIINKYEASFTGKDFDNDKYVRYTYPNLDKEDYMQDSYNENPIKNNKPTNYSYSPLRYENFNDKKEGTTTIITIPSTATTISIEEEPTTTIIPIEEEPTTTIIPIEEEPTTTIIPIEEEPTTTVIPIEEESTTTIISIEEEPTTTMIPVVEEPTITIISIEEEPTTTIIPVDEEPTTTIIPVEEPTTTTALIEEPTTTTALIEEPTTTTALIEETTTTTALIEEPTTTTVLIEETTKTTDINQTPNVETCWSEKFGYPCCTSSCYVYETDSNGEWGFENNQWCGISPSCYNCWSLRYGYPCCTSSCIIYDVNSDGNKWGYENNQWCGIIKENC